MNRFIKAPSHKWLAALGSLFVSSWLTGCAPPTFEQAERPPLVYPKAPDEPRFYHERTLRSSLDVNVSSEEDRLMRFMTGTYAAGSGLGKPFAAAAHGSRLYVTDPGMRRGFIFDAAKRSFSEFGVTDPGQLRRPYDIDIDAKGNLYVIDGTLKEVMIYDPNGKFLRKFGNPELLNFASYLAVTPDGKTVYVTDTGGVSSEKHEILIFNGQTGELTGRFGSRGSGDGQFNLPKDVEYSPSNDRLYVVDSGNFRTCVFTPAGEFERCFGQIGLKFGSFARPKGVAADAEGRIYVSDAAFGNFQIFTPDGQLLLFIGERNVNGDRGEFFLPAGIEVDQDGRIYMVDQYHKKVDIFRPAALAEEQGGFSFKIPEPKKQ